MVRISLYYVQQCLESLCMYLPVRLTYTNGEIFSEMYFNPEKYALRQRKIGISHLFQGGLPIFSYIHLRILSWYIHLCAFIRPARKALLG